MAKEETKTITESEIFDEKVAPDIKQPTSGKKDREVSISEDSLKAMLERLEVLENDKTARSIAEDEAFNPLKEVKSEKEVRVTYFNDKLVVGYISKVRPDGREIFVTNEIIEEGEFKGQLRGYVTVEYLDGTTEKVDHIRFLENSYGVVAKIISQKDIGKLVEQGEVTKMNWNGRALVPTSTRIMTGEKIQKFIFEVELKDGKRVTLPQNIINIH